MKSKKEALITDLDNTLFDWVDLWINCFSPMLDKIVEISGIPKDTLLPEIAAIHQRHGTSEYSFLVEEIPSIQLWLNGRSAVSIFSSAIDIFREQRRKHLKLYPTVLETLSEIKKKGALIIGYTESMAFYANYRIKKLKLDGILDYIYCPKDHKIPANINIENLRKYSSEHYSLENTIQRFTPAGSKKPDKAVLNTILQEINIEKSSCVYIGDSLMKDIAMAKDCGVQSIWAEYGLAHIRPEYDLLRKVTHWTPAEVERERQINSREHVTPDYTATERFSEVLDNFDFSPHRKGI